MVAPARRGQAAGRLNSTHDRLLGSFIPADVERPSGPVKAEVPPGHQPEGWKQIIEMPADFNSRWVKIFQTEVSKVLVEADFGISQNRDRHDA